MRAVAAVKEQRAHDYGGTIHYHTDRLDRRNYQASFGQLCNNSLCLQERKDSENHVPVLSLHELERRQKVASLQRMYIASQHYQPHIERPASSNGTRSNQNIASSRISYDFGVDGLKAQLSFRISPTSPPRNPYSNRFSVPAACHDLSCNRPPPKDTVRVIYNDTCIRCPSRQLARVPRNQRLSKVPLPKLKFCARPDDFVTNFPLMVLRGPLMGSHVGEGEHAITFKTLYPLPAKTCRYTLKVYALRCPPLPVLRHGSFYCTNENLWGSRCLFKCDKDFMLRSSLTMPYKCVKRKREAIWKVPAILPQCIAHERRRLACRWPRAPKNGWSACGLRGRWKKRLFVKENVPCYQGCSAGYVPSVSLEPLNRSRISCVGGSWRGLKDFECLPPTFDDVASSRECRKIAEKTPNVLCRESGEDILCSLECPEGLVIPQKQKSRGEIRCGALEPGYRWPSCRARTPPLLVSGCKDEVIRDVTFPYPIKSPVFRSEVAGGEVKVTCDRTVIESFGKFSIACTARDMELQSEASCTYTMTSRATSCERFTPGEHTIPRCRFPRHEVEFAETESFPVKSECEFVCSPGYVIATSQTEDFSYTVCTEEGAWSLSDFNICRRNYL
ncbi:uncharacterized protein LOC114828494 [Galendromus occidentalis]|uniref:Uncharacterized protein LOC114828494 n=1 Tax=Galendromus occidentalis TaxID=34638 RepID=A0AAJ7SJ24_9ACAR|nr:uncharacterized protein LOC114828494 [Galendromus occidentalis]